MLLIPELNLTSSRTRARLYSYLLKKKFTQHFLNDVSIKLNPALWEDERVGDHLIRIYNIKELVIERFEPRYMNVITAEF